MNRYFAKEDKQMASKQEKRCPTPLAIRKMQMKPTMRCYYASIRIAQRKKKKKATTWHAAADVEKLPGTRAQTVDPETGMTLQRSILSAKSRSPKIRAV